MLFLEASISILLAQALSSWFQQSSPAVPAAPVSAAAGPLEPTSRLDPKTACAQDVKRACRRSGPEAAEQRCLSDHWAELDPSCQKALGSPLPDPCAGDIQKWSCASGTAGSATGDCLFRNRERLSPACREYRESKQRGNPCYPILSIYCQDAPSRDARQGCLLTHIAEASSGCLADILDNPSIRPCAQDAERLCGRRKGPARRKCLDAHLGELSPLCRKFRERISRESPCREDKLTFCPDIQGGATELWLCLRKNLGKLSAACTDSVQEETSRRPCHDDRERFCKDVAAGSGKACLADHAKQLSPPCLKSLLSGERARDRSGNPLPND